MLILISKGWTILRMDFSRQETLFLMVIMSLVYLGYSAYYVSFGMESLKQIISVLINIIYIFLYFLILRFSLQTQATIKLNLDLVGPNQ